MSEKDTKMLSNSLDVPLTVVNRVDFTQGITNKEPDAKNLEKSASSPDSAIDLTEDNKHCAEFSTSMADSAVPVVTAMIDSILEEVFSTTKRRNRKKKKEKFTDSEKWNLIMQCGSIGWKRILARNCDDEGGWGFNFVSPTGLKLTVKELERFLRKKRLDMDDLVFEATKSIELTQYPRKKAKLKMGHPRFKIRDLKLPKKLEIERKRKIAQARLANRPTFKSVSEFLASLERCDSQNSSCSDASRNIEYSDEEYEESDTSFSVDESSENDVSLLCKELVDECIEDAVEYAHNPSVNTDTKMKTLERSIEEVQQRLSKMLEHSPAYRSQKPIEKLKIRLGEKTPSQTDRTPEKAESEVDKLKAFRIKKHITKSENLESTPDKKLESFKIKLSGKSTNAPEDPIEKLIITPERLKERHPSLNNTLTSELNSPTSLKIKLPKDTPERIKLTIKTPKTNDLSAKKKKKKIKERRDSEGKELTHLKIKPIVLPCTKEEEEASETSSKKPKKYSIFKTRNDGKECRENSQVNFTDNNAKKSLNIRASLGDSGSGSRSSDWENSDNPVVIPILKIPKVDHENIEEFSEESQNVSIFQKHSTSLKIQIDDDLDDQNIDDEFTQAVQLESPHSKVKVVQQSVSSTPPVRRNIFGPHSPMCKDEISPEKSESPKHHKNDLPDKTEVCDKEVKPGRRTHGRLLSNEDAILAIDAVVDPSNISKAGIDGTEDANIPLLKKSQVKPATDNSLLSPQSTDRSRLTTPSLPGPVPTPTPSLPILSPHEYNEDYSHSNMTTPSLPSLSPAVRRGTPVTNSVCNSPSLPSLSPAPSKLPENNAAKLPKRPEGILPRRLQTMKMMEMDPSKSTPLSVEIPSSLMSNHNSYSSSHSEQSSLESAEPTPNTTETSSANQEKVLTPNPSPLKPKPLVEASPIEVSETGRRMRGCRKFIHYEFSPPFASSESSVSEVDSVEIVGETNSVKKLTKKRGRPRKNASTEECLSSPNSLSSRDSQQTKNRGKPAKSKSTDSRDDAFTFDEESNGSDIFPLGIDGNKKKRGRPSKKKLSVCEEPKLSVSEMAEKMTESQISPITREKMVLPKSSLEREAQKKQIISLQRESLLQRRNSEDTKKVKKPSKVERSKSIDTSAISKGRADDKFEGLEELKKKLRTIPIDQLLLKNVSQTSENKKAALHNNDMLQEETIDAESSEIESSSENHQAVEEGKGRRQFGEPYNSQSRDVQTLIVRKKVRVQEYSEPLMTIRDKLPKYSPPPQMIEDEGRPVTPPPGTCTIYEENLDLVDGLRVLTKIGSHFYPGRVKAIDSPFIFAVSVDGERGNKPHIYPAEELLEKTILEVRPVSRRYTPVGTRVCVLWSSKLNFLYPGTVKSFSSVDKYIIVTLDDGDEREVHIDNVKLLPKGYPKVIGGSKESPIGLVESSTMSRLSVSAIHVDKTQTLSNSDSGVYDFEETDNAKPKIKSTNHVKFKQGKYGAVGNKLVAKSKTLAESKSKRDKKKTEYQKKLFEQRTSKSVADGDIDYDIESHEKPTTEKPKVEVKDATLSQDMLKDGLRLLTKIDGHFYPGRLNAIRPPDIYGILLDNERGFRPIIYAREELLKDAIKEIKIKTADIPMGTRICAYWSAKYHYLHPGTIIPVNTDVEKYPGKYLNVVLDDGDKREIHIDQMRLLPNNYPKVAYKEQTPSPRKKGSSRPSSRSETPKSGSKSDLSRPSSSLSNHSDNEYIHKNIAREIKREVSPLPKIEPEQRILDPPDFKDFKDRNAPQIGTVKNSPSVSKENTPLTSPVKLPPKVFIPEPPSKPVTIDLVGLISKGIDKLVDKKVVGNRNNHSPFIRPLDNQSIKPRPPLPPSNAMGPYLPGMQQPSFPSRPSSSESSPASSAPSPTPTDEGAAPTPPTGETGIKAKSRLSSLIQAMSGKMKKPENAMPSPPPVPPPPPAPFRKVKSEEASPHINIASTIANKWQLAFNVNTAATPKPSPVKTHTKEKTPDQVSETTFSENNSPQSEVSDDVEDGYLNSNNIVPGIKILLLKDSCFHPATIVSIDSKKMYGIRLKYSKTHEVLYYSEEDLILNTVLEREAMTSDNLEIDMRVAAYLKNRLESLYTGTVIERKPGDIILVAMDGGVGHEEVQVDNIRILPSSYPKVFTTESKDLTPSMVSVKNEQIESTSSAQVNEVVPKTKHKHNILLGYDFVDEPDCEVQAWDLAISRKNKKAKNQMDSLKVTDIKQEPESVSESVPVANAQDLKTSEKGKDVSDVIQKLNDLDQIDLNEEETINTEVNSSVQTMLTQISLEERMRISLLSDVLKKHSPKKNILQKLPRAKSPRSGPEPLKKEKKRNSKDSVQKRLSMEETPPTGDNLQNTIDDITSELLSICKESNIDTPKQQQKQQNLEQEQQEQQQDQSQQQQQKPQSKYQEAPSEQYTQETEQQEQSVEYSNSMKNEIRKGPLPQTDEPVKGILTVEELIGSTSLGQEDQNKEGEITQEEPEEHDLLTFYSTKNLSQDKPSEQQNAQNVGFKPILFVDETKIDESAEDNLKDQNLEINHSNIVDGGEGQHIDNMGTKDIHVKHDNLSHSSDLSVVRKQGSDIEVTPKNISTESTETEKHELEEFNSGIIPEVMTSDVKTQSKVNEGVTEKASELSVSFELSGDESVSIELSPNKDSEKDPPKEKIGKKTRSKRTTKDNVNKQSEAINESKKEADFEANILQISFDKGETDSKLSDKDLTDESLNTSGFDISSIINRLEDEEEDEIDEHKNENKGFLNNLNTIEENLLKDTQDKDENMKKKKKVGRTPKLEASKNKESEIKTELKEEKAIKKSSKKEVKMVDNEVSENLSELNSKHTLKEAITPNHAIKEDEVIKDENTKNNENEADTKSIDADKSNNKIDNGFVYIDPNMPQGWYVIVRKRTDGKPDSYFHTPCHTKLRSKSEIIKFVEGSLPSKPMKKPILISEIPLRENLTKEYFDLTRDIDPTIFETPKNTGETNTENSITAHNESNSTIKTDEKIKAVTSKLSDKPNKTEKGEEGNTKKEVDNTKKEEQKKKKDLEKLKKDDEKKKKENLKTEEEIKKDEEEQLNPREVQENTEKEVSKSKKVEDNANKNQAKSNDENFKGEEEKLKKDLGKLKTKKQNEKSKKDNLNTKKENVKEKSPKNKTKVEENKVENKQETTKKEEENVKKQNKKNKKDANDSSNNEKKKSPKKIKGDENTDKKKNNILSKTKKGINKAKILKSKIEKKKMLLKKKGKSIKNNKKQIGVIDTDAIEGNTDSKDEHVFKVPSLESFRLQKNKSTKLLSPPIPKLEETKDKTNLQTTIDSEREIAEESKIDKIKNTTVKKLVSVKLKSIMTSDEKKAKTLLENKNESLSNVKSTKESDQPCSKSQDDIMDESHGQKSNTKISDTFNKESSVNSELSDTEEVDDGPKRNKKLVKTRKTRNTEETSDDDLSPKRKGTPISETKSSTEGDNEPSNITASDKIGQKRKTRSQSLTSESESESEDDKPSKKCSPKSKVFKQCENSHENKENKEKETSGRKIKKNNSHSKNSESENDSDEGNQKRRTRQQKNLEGSDSKEGGSDKENELSPTEMNEVEGKEEDKDIRKLIQANEKVLSDPVKEEIGLSKKDEVNVTRRTRGSIKSKDEMEEEKIKEDNSENDDKNPVHDELRTTRSKVATNENNNEDELDQPRNIAGKKKTRSGSTASIEGTEERADTPTRLTRGKLKNESSESNVLEAGKRTLRKRSNSEGSNSSSVSPSRSSPDNKQKKSNTPIPSKDSEEEDDDGEIVLSMPKQLREKIISENTSPLSSPKDKEQPEENVDHNTSKTLPIFEITKAEKRKLSEEIDSPVINNAHKKKKLLGPKSQRKNISNQDDSDGDMEEETQKSKEPRLKKKMLGPKSKRKKSDILSDTEDEEEDSTEGKNNDNGSGESNSNESDENNSKEIENSEEEKKTQSDQVNPSTPITPTLSFIQKKKHAKCDLKLVSLFKHELCKAKCAHCQEMGKYTMHMVHFDMPQKIIQMECQSCNWTTVRRMVVTTRVVG